MVRSQKSEVRRNGQNYYSHTASFVEFIAVKTRQSNHNSEEKKQQIKRVRIRSDSDAIK